MVLILESVMEKEPQGVRGEDGPIWERIRGT